MYVHLYNSLYFTLLLQYVTSLIKAEHLNTRPYVRYEDDEPNNAKQIILRQSALIVIGNMR